MFDMLIENSFVASGIDIFGLVVFLLPAMILIGTLSWPFFLRAFESGEMSQNAGGLIRWPVYALMPLGFALLTLQGVSELIKRIAFLKGLIASPVSTKTGKTAEEELAEEIRSLAQGEGK